MDALRARSARPLRLNFDEFPGNARLSTAFDSTTTRCVVDTRRARWVDTEVDAAWLFVPPIVDLPEEVSTDTKDIAVRESEAFLEGLWMCFPVPWLNHPCDVKSASNRIVQFDEAGRVGFTVPKTLVTARPEEVKEFLRECDGGAILKDINLPYWSSASGSFTSFTKSIDSYTDEYLDAARFAPVLVQERIEKDHEIRAFVVGDQVMAVGIGVDGSSGTATDFRRQRGSVSLWREELPLQESERCISLARRYSLGYAAIDLAQTKQGEYVFFEMGATSSWTWVQARSGLRVTDTIADHLIHIATDSAGVSV